MAARYMEAVDRRDDAAPPRVGFLFIGGAHQMLHTAPVAAELARAGACEVRLIVGSVADRDRLSSLMRDLGREMPIEVLPAPAWLRALRFRQRTHPSPKRLQLLVGRRTFDGLDVLVTAERTSTILKRLPGFSPRIVHIPHGAGDRGQGFERRIRAFDHVIVAGRKDRDRMIEDGLVPAAACSVSGYVKLSAVLRMRERRRERRLFDNERPTVLYNPHFATGLGSWPMFGDAFARAAAAMTDHNFILAPHVRLAHLLPPDERGRLARLAVPGRVHVDLGSERSCDMTYTLAADIYVGDVSSQVYEFLHAPKPCLFLNATGGDRRGDRDFACWRFGEVIDDPAALAGAIRDAPGRHPAFRPAQVSGAEEAMGARDGDAAAVAARIVARLAHAAAGREAEALS